MAFRRTRTLVAAKGILVRGVMRSVGVQGWSGVGPQQKREVTRIKAHRIREESRLLSRSRHTRQLLGEEAPLCGSARWGGRAATTRAFGVSSLQSSQRNQQQQQRRKQQQQPVVSIGGKDRVSTDIYTEAFLPLENADLHRNRCGNTTLKAKATEAATVTTAKEATLPRKYVGNDGATRAGVVASMDVPDFNDTVASYGPFSTWELVRAYLVLRACAIKSLVDNSEALLRIGYGTVGETLTNAVLKMTFFAHFCAGETAQEIGQRASDLRAHGVGGILDYAAEVDLRPPEERANREEKRRFPGGDTRLVHEDPAQCRTYDYIGEAACDARTSTFLECIRAVRDQTPGGFAAVKLSALGDPALLSRLTTCIRMVRGLFKDFDANQDGAVSSPQEFQEGCRRWFVSEMEEDRAALIRTMELLDLEDTKWRVDHVEWSSRMRPANLGEITTDCGKRGHMAAAALDDEGLALKEAMQRRIGILATAASVSGVRLMIDAEQSWLQPSIDNTIYGLQFNRDFPTIFTTHQCYLKDSLEGLANDLDRADRGGYVWAGKLVRGAYMVSERERAKVEGYESPVFETIEDTHANYDAAVAMVLDYMARGSRAEVMVATHNQASIERTIGRMQERGIAREDGVSFGQLLGMADNVTFPLGAHGYKAYKYVPYGKVGETIPYLLRRAQENSGMLGGASHERALLAKEISRRVFG